MQNIEHILIEDYKHFYMVPFSLGECECINLFLGFNIVCANTELIHKFINKL